MEAVGTGAAANVCSAVATCIFEKAKRYITYVRIYRRNLDKFEEKLKMLIIKRESVQQKVDTAKKNAEKILADVEGWCDRVDKIEEKQKKVKELEDKAMNKCFIGLCPNIKCRHDLSTMTEDVANDVDELLEEGGRFTGVSYRDVPEDSVDGPPKDFEAFESREKVFNDVMETLKDSTIRMIGVYGMAGVGKTTLVNEVVRQAKREKLFDAVVTVVVRQTPEIQEIQNQIADPLGLKFEEQSVIGRSSRLCERLKKEKILIVLDDIWAGLDLKEIGIPLNDPEKRTGGEIPFGDENKGCNILLTSRDRNVLTNEMDAQKIFQINVLKEKEAWDLFKKKAGDTVESPELRSTATEVAKKCAGLPVAIATVGRALRNKDIYAWKDALRQLRRPSSRNLRGVSREVYLAIELSYNHLEDDELKLTFQICSLLGPHVEVELLLRLAMGLGLFHGCNIVDDNRNRLLTLVKSLKDSCLLNDCYQKGCVVMHDLLYDVALAIASRDNKFVLNPEAVLTDWPDGDTMEKCTAIALQFANISSFPKELKCPQLTFLSVQSKDSSMELPASIFEETKNLRVLSLFNLHFSSLPSSIRFLTNLRTLSLENCSLGDIALIGHLKNLESLSLLNSDIEMLPKEIGQLIELRLFDLRGCTQLKLIPPRVLSSLLKLEELYLGNSFVQWEVERQANQQTNATLSELKLLPRLTTLEIHIPDAKIMPGDLFFDNLERYKIFIGKSWDWVGVYEYSRTLKLVFNISTDHLVDGVKMLLKRTEDLYLDDMRGDKVALPKLIDEEGYQQLKKLHIQNCSDIQYIVDDNGAANENEFCQLRSLTLRSLPQLVSFSGENKRSSTSRSQHKLSLFGEKMVFPCLENLRLSSINVERIWQHQLPNKSFCTLENLIIEGCDNLKHLLSSSMAKSLLNLKYFEIAECKYLREIIFSEEDGIEEQVALFPQLKTLKIKNLQNLIGFCSEDCNIDFPSLTLLEIEHCPTLGGFIYKSRVEDNQRLSPQALFDEKVAFPNVEKLRIVHLRNMEMIWHNKLTVNSFCKLKDMTVEHCNKLVRIFPGDMWSTFLKLETLKVNNCGSLEEIFEVQSLFNMGETYAMATGFRELYIGDLPKLKHVWCKDPQGILTFQNLSVLYVWGCWSLRTHVFPASIGRDLPQLKVLYIERCRVEEIVSKEEGSETSITFAFDELSSLTFCDVPNLKCFYPGMHVTEWPMLKRLVAFHCPKVKIFGMDTVDEDDGQHDSLTQRQPPLFLFEKVISKLEQVSLNSDDINAIISDHDKFSSDHFRAIKDLAVSLGFNEFSVLPITFLERFKNLEILRIISCAFKKLFLYEGTTTLASIKTLNLVYLYYLKHVWKPELRLDNVLPNLEILGVSCCPSLISLGSCLAPFQNLITLDVWRCKAMINLVTSAAAVQSLVQLQTLTIRECESIKEVVGQKGGQATDDIVFIRLKYLELWDLPSLASFCSGNHTFEFPSLEQLLVIQCPNLEIFCKGVLNVPMLQSVQATAEDKKGHWGGDLNSTVKQLHTKEIVEQEVEHLILSDSSRSIDIWNLNFQNLKVLEVKDCSSLTYIFTISMALNLVQLNKVKVNNCPTMEQIIRDEGVEEATTSTIMLPRLEDVSLESCSNLTSFFLGNRALECPSLEEMTIVDCPKMFEFTSAFSRKQDMEKIGGVNASFFNDKVFCPSLQKLELTSLNIKKIWPHHQTQVTSYNVQNLRSFIVEGCHSLKYILTSSLCEKLAQLAVLWISDCTNVREVIFRERLMTETQTQLIEAETTKFIVFPEMRSLALERLPKLKCFYSKIHTTKWPLLQALAVNGCNKVETFARDVMERQGESALEIFQQPLFWVNQDPFPNLEMLYLGEYHGIMKDIYHGRLPTKYFPKVSWLKLRGFPENAITLPNCFIQSLPNLTKLRLSRSPFNEIFECEGISRLKKLKISKLAELTHLWKEGIPPAEVFSNLITLKVFGCNKLENVLLPSSVPLKNLTTLAVSKCHGLKNLVTLPTARSLMLLERLSVTDCHMMKEIIASTTGDEVMDGIIFSQLKSLELGCLPSLARFCSGNYSFGFPSLETLIMKQCPKMESFSEAELSTPMLQGVQSTEDEYVGCWEGDLNAIIRQLFLERVFPSMEDLEQSSINSQRIWHWKLLAASSSAQNLTCLIVEGCPNFKCLFSSSMVRSFVQLKMLHIDHCENVETIIFMEGSGEGELMSQKSFRVLDSLLLKDLPKLTRFCHGSYIEFPLLRFLRIQSCPTLKTFISNSVIGNGTRIDQEAGIVSPALFSEKVAFLCLEELRIFGVGKWRKIWHADQPTNSVRVHFAN